MPRILEGVLNENRCRKLVWRGTRWMGSRWRLVTRQKVLESYFFGCLFLEWWKLNGGRLSGSIQHPLITKKKSHFSAYWFLHYFKSPDLGTPPGFFFLFLSPPILFTFIYPSWIFPTTGLHSGSIKLPLCSFQTPLPSNSMIKATRQKPSFLLNKILNSFFQSLYVSEEDSFGPFISFSPLIFWSCCFLYFFYTPTMVPFLMEIVLLQIKSSLPFAHLGFPEPSQHGGSVNNCSLIMGRLLGLGWQDRNSVQRASVDF